MVRMARQVAPTSETPDHAAIVRQLVEAVNAHDVEGVVALWVPGGTERTNASEQTLTAPQGHRRFFSELFAACPDHRMELVETLAEDGRVAARFRVHGTFAAGSYDGLLATGRPYADVEELALFTVDDGLIQSSFTILDQAEFGRQIGFLPRTGSRAERATKALFNVMVRLRRASSVR